MAGKISRPVGVVLLVRASRFKARSLSLACLAFALIGVPLGVTARRKETSTGLVVSLMVAAAYFSGMLFTKPLDDSPLPVIMTVLWLPNVCCLFLGMWLFHRASFR